MSDLGWSGLQLSISIDVVLSIEFICSRKDPHKRLLQAYTSNKSHRLVLSVTIKAYLFWSIFSDDVFVWPKWKDEKQTTQDETRYEPLRDSLKITPYRTEIPGDTYKPQPRVWWVVDHSYNFSLYWIDGKMCSIADSCSMEGESAKSGKNAQPTASLYINTIIM